MKRFIAHRRDFLKTACPISMAAWNLPSVSMARIDKALHLDQIYAELDAINTSVASGDPDFNSVSLWTRLHAGARDHLQEGSIAVRVQVSTSSKFEPQSIVYEKDDFTDHTEFFCLNHRAVDLPHSFNTYYYRFLAETGWHSDVGTTKTFPRPDESPKEFRLAYASCQKYIAGFYNAYSAVMQGDFHALAFLGDFIYETGGRAGLPGNVRSDLIATDGQVKTLDEYRLKYLLYLSDPWLQMARAKLPWIHIWDDHEIFNNYAGGDLFPHEQQIKKNAVQAFSEFIPINKAQMLGSDKGELKLYRSFSLGSLGSIIATDLRQYRSGPACLNSQMAPKCSETYNPERSILGKTQKAWLKNQLALEKGRWKLILNSVMMQPVKVTGGVGPLSGFLSEIKIIRRHFLNFDSWDGFPLERQELNEFFHNEGISNIVYLTGDIHNYFAANLHLDPLDSNSPLVGNEIVTASISSGGLSSYSPVNLNGIAKRYLKWMNRGLQYANFEKHGIVGLTISQNEIKATLHAVDSASSDDNLAYNLQNLAIGSDDHMMLKESTQI